MPDRFNIKYKSQRDPKWSNITINDTNITLGRMGCTITCISMLSDFFGCEQNPDEIAKKASNFCGSGNADISWIGLNFPTFSFRWREGMLIKNANVNNDLDLDMINSYLAGNKDSANRMVILEVANSSHWVVGLWKTSDGDILAIDPWTGTTCEVLKKYKNITGAALFIRSKIPAWRGKGKPQAPLYN